MSVRGSGVMRFAGLPPGGPSRTRRHARATVGGVSDDLRNQMTREAYEALEAELATLEGEGRQAMAERIKTARAWGDLKENAEDHDGKDAQAHLETKINLLQQRRRNAMIVESAAAGADHVGLGSSV